MAITNAFRSAVAEGKVRSIRIMMKDSLLVDPTFSEFNEMENYSKNMNGLYDTYDGREFKKDETAWNDDYMNKLMVQVVSNFSPERISHLKEVVKHLRPVASNSSAGAASSGGSNGSNRSRSDHTRSDHTRSDHTRGNNYTQRETRSSYSQSLRPSYHQQKWIDAQNNRIRTKRVATGAVGGGIVVGTAAAITGASFIGGAVVGAVAVGAVLWIATNRR